MTSTWRPVPGVRHVFRPLKVTPKTIEGKFDYGYDPSIVWYLELDCQGTMAGISPSVN